jgi:hypothetical protein
MEWNVKDLKSVCMFEKTKEDGKLPTKKESFVIYTKRLWNGRDVT